MRCIWWHVDHLPAALVLTIGAKTPLEYDTKSNFLNMDAQKDVQSMRKALKISSFISPMLHTKRHPFRVPFYMEHYGHAPTLTLCV